LEDKQESLLLEERARSDQLLRNILPEDIAVQLKNRKGEGDNAEPIARRLDDASVVFTDIAGFTESTRDSSPEQLVRVLNALVVRFDTLCRRHGLEKIKTIGDAYMCIGGLDERRRTTHASDAVLCGLAMIQSLQEIAHIHPLAARWKLRVGINTGPIVCGVIGQDKFQFDTWGPVVNIASRMESTAPPNRVQVSRDTLVRIHDQFVYEEREQVHVKGVGDVRTAVIVGPIDGKV
jgi:adenylate cyclase